MKLNGTIKLRGDKSISHRAIMIASLIDDCSVIENISICEDVFTTISCLRQCNVKIKYYKSALYIKGGNLINPKKELNCANSGTTARMLLGLLAGQNIKAVFKGDNSLSMRPMGRIIKPLNKMKANIISNKGYLPIKLNSGVKLPIVLKTNINSAQVKSSLLFAGMGLHSYSQISYNKNTRDHTERLLNFINYDIKFDDNIKVRQRNIKKGFKIFIPGDISNASFVIVAALLIPESTIIIKKLLYNKTRIEFIRILVKMGANIEIKNIKLINSEYLCDVKVMHTSNLKNITIDKRNIIPLIDEIPILSIIATQGKGKTTIKDAQELRLKECDRIHAICENLSKMNADIVEQEDGFIINGGKRLYYTTINHYNDHRIAMSFEILNLFLNHRVSGKYKEILNISFPEFYSVIKKLIK